MANYDIEEIRMSIVIAKANKANQVGIIIDRLRRKQNK